MASGSPSVCHGVDGCKQWNSCCSYTRPLHSCQYAQWSMAESLLALHQCSLLGLDDSPDLLRRSLLQRDGSQDCLLWNSKEAHQSKAVQRLAFTPAAAGRNSSTSSLAQAVAACELSLRQAGTSILDSSLPLFSSESPAIVGKQLPRSRFRKRSKAGAAGGNATGTDQHTLLQQKQGQQAGPPAADGAARVHSSNASSACLELSTGILSSNADHLNRSVHPAMQPQHWDAQQCFHNKENHCPAVAGDAAAADNSKSSQPSEGKNDLSLLQALLDDSNCSAASLLQPSLGTLLQTDVAPAAAAGIGSYYYSYEVRHSCMSASTGSDVSSFQGFWGPRSAVRSPFSTPHTTRAPAAAGALAISPRSLLTDAAVGGTGASPAAAVAGFDGAGSTSECQSSCDAWQECYSAQQPDNTTEQATKPKENVVPAEATAQVDERSQQHQQHLQQQQPGWDQLLLLLSLDESVSLMQVAAQTCDPDNHTTVEAAAHSSQQVGGLLQVAELQRPSSTDSLTTDGSEPSSPSVLAPPAGTMLPTSTKGSSWGGFGLVSSRYSDCCPSPASPDVFGSPTVLLSSPVMDAAGKSAAVDGVTAASRHRSVLKQSCSSNKAEACTAAGLTTEEDAMHSQTEQSDQQAAGEGAAAVAACGSADDHNQHPPRPNSIEYSPIRGVTLCDNNGASPNVAGWPGMPVSTSPGQQQEPSQPQQQFVHAPSSAADNVASPSWHLHHQQDHQEMHEGKGLLQQLLDDSSESWTDSGVLREQLPQNPSNAGFATQALPASAADCMTPQHGQQQQQQGQPASGQATAHNLPSSLRLRLSESQGALTLSPGAWRSQSPAESVDSFTYAAAGEPYCGIEDGQKQHDHQADSQEWSAYEGLGEVLTPGAVATPATVACKNGWGEHVARQTSGVADVCAATPEPFAAVVGAAASTEANFSRADGGVVKLQANFSAALDSNSEPIPSAAGDHMSDIGCSLAGFQQSSNSNGAGVADTAAMQELVERLAIAELQCGKHQQEAMQARQVTLEKELELQILRNALKISEVEGSSCLDALADTIDLITAADGNISVINSVELMSVTAGGPSAAVDCKVSQADPLDHSSSTRDQQQPQQDADQLQQQNAALLQHNAAMQATMAEAAQQLDILEARVTELSAEKAAAEALLSEAEQQWNEQLLKQEEFTHSELEEQQQQHEEEVRDLHSRLEDVSNQLQQAQQEVSCQAEQLQQLQTELESCQQELSASQQQVQRQQQQLQDLEQQLAGRASDSAASTEQLQRQVQQLLTAKRELQETNARLIDAEAEYASNQMILGGRNQELATQLKEAKAANEQLEETMQQLQAQNSSLSQICQSLKAASGSGQPSSAITAASNCTTGVASGEAAEAGPTPMRRRMAGENQQLERRCQQLLEQKQQLAQQLEELQQQLQEGSGSAAVAADAAAQQQQQALLQELHAQVEHLSTCNDELLAQLQDLDFEHQQLRSEREELVIEIEQLNGTLAQLQLAKGDDSRAAAAPDRDSVQGAAALVAASAAEQAEAELQADNAALLQDIEQLQTELLVTKQILTQQQQHNELLQIQMAAAAAAAASNQQQMKQEPADARTAAADCEQLTKQLAAVQQRLDDALQQHQQQQQQSHEDQLQASNTALFGRCQELQSQLQLLQREHEQQRVAAAAAAAPRGSKSNPAKRDQEQLVAELRGRLKDVLDLLEEKQQLQKQQAKHHDAREVELDAKCNTLAQQLRESQRQTQQLQMQHDDVVTELQDLRIECERLLQSNKDLQQQLVAARSDNGTEHELLVVQQQLSSLQVKHSEVTARLADLSSDNDRMKSMCDALQQRLAAAEVGKAAAEQAAAAAGITALDAEKAAAAAERNAAELERAVDRLHQQNQALIEQTVQLQLVDSPAAPTICSSKAVQVELAANAPAIAAADGSLSSKQRKRWTADLAVQVDLGATTEQATAVQQLLLLQAQQQLQDMEQQNKQAAQRLVESKSCMGALQSNIQQQEQQLKTAEQKLAQATALHKQQSLSLQNENSQLIRQLADDRKQLAVLQSANKQLESKVSQQQGTVERLHHQLEQKQQELLEQQQALEQKQKELAKLAATVAASQQQLQDLRDQVLDLQHQQTQDNVHVATAAAELQKAKEDAQQLLAAKDRNAASVVALQQQIQQLQLQGQQQQQAIAGSESAAAAAQAAAREELGRSKQQLQLLVQEKEALVVELQQTKVAVDFLEDSVRRLGQHNASLVQQLQDTIAAAATATETQASYAKTAARLAVQQQHDMNAATAVQSSGPISPRTLQQIITAATKVNEKNKRLKRQLQSLQGPK